VILPNPRKSSISCANTTVHLDHSSASSRARSLRPRLLRAPRCGRSMPVLRTFMCPGRKGRRRPSP
jgi:hypothetical protein